MYKSSIFASATKSAPADWLKKPRIRIVYLDYVSAGEFLLLLLAIPKFLLDTIKELWTSWQHYKYEIYVSDWEEEREKGLAESFQRWKINESKINR